MTQISDADVVRVLATIKAAHGPMDVGEAAIKFWTMSLRLAGVTNVKDATEAVVRHYSTPGANPWITPGDVIGHYKEIRWERIKDIQDGQLTPDVPGDAPGWVHTRTAQARAKAVEDGMPIPQAVAGIAPVKALRVGP